MNFNILTPNIIENFLYAFGGGAITYIIFFLKEKKSKRDYDFYLGESEEENIEEDNNIIQKGGQNEYGKQ